MLTIIIITVLASFFTGCSDEKDFKGKSGAAAPGAGDGEATPAADAGATTKPGKPGEGPAAGEDGKEKPKPVESNLTDSEKEAVDACLNDFGTVDLPEAKLARPRRIVAKASGFSGQFIDDRGFTDPEFVLVKIEAKEMGAVMLRLSNDKGWYCLYSEASTFSSINVEAPCNAKVNANNVQTADMSAVLVHRGFCGI